MEQVDNEMRMRRHTVYRVFVTKNSEYHLRGCTCTGVRDRRSGCWLPDHPALGMNLTSIYMDDDGRMQPTALPRIGEPLTLVKEGQPVRTSTVLGIEVRAHGIAPGDTAFEDAFEPAMSPRETY